MKYKEIRDIIENIWNNVISNCLWINGFADTETLNDIKYYMLKKLDDYNDRAKNLK